MCGLLVNVKKKKKSSVPFFCFHQWHQTRNVNLYHNVYSLIWEQGNRKQVVFLSCHSYYKTKTERPRGTLPIYLQYYWLVNSDMYILSSKNVESFSSDRNKSVVCTPVRLWRLFHRAVVLWLTRYNSQICETVFWNDEWPKKKRKCQLVGSTNGLGTIAVLLSIPPPPLVKCNSAMSMSQHY